MSAPRAWTWRVVAIGLVAGALLRAAADDSPGVASPADLALVRADEARRIAVLERAARSVVCIFADNRRTGGGSGVIFDERGYGLTNFHVVAEFIDSRRGVGGLNDGNLYPLTVIGLDPGGDIALFKLDGKPRFDAAPLGDSDALIVGQWAAAVGNPFILAEDYTPTVTLGVVSGLHRYQEGQGNALEYADCIQVSSSINPGNSGGPLFDLAGQVIGINGRASFEERGRVNVGLGYAVSINQVKRFLPSLRAGRLCAHGTLGATVALANQRLIFDAVQDSAPASDAGIQVGDTLLSVNGRVMRTPNDFNNLLATLPENWPVRLAVQREEQPFEVVARLERLPIRRAPPFILDLKRNHAELRLVLNDARLALLGTADRVRSVQWTGSLQSFDVAGPREIDVVSSSDGRVVVQQSDSGELLYERSAGSDSTAGVPAAATAALWREWHLLSAALLFPPELTVGWEFVGGDELDNQVVAVIERRLDAHGRIRWYFDAESGALREVNIDDPAAGNSLWRPDPPADGARPFVRTWVRYGPDGAAALVIDAADIELEPAATGAGS